jgi:hypothetical protein
MTLTPGDVVVVKLTDTERDAILYHAKEAIVGGSSALYGMGARRAIEIRENQVVAMACEGAFAKWQGEFGHFIARRVERNKAPTQGDGGVDHVLRDGRKVDVKGTEANGTQELVKKALQLCLTHAPRVTVVKDISYVLAITRRRLDLENETPDTVALVGWLYGQELRDRTDRDDLKGWSAFGHTLHPMSLLAPQPMLQPALPTKPRAPAHYCVRKTA